MKVKMLMNAGPHVAGEIVDVDPETAKALCQKTIVEMGGGLKKEQRKAMPIDEVEALDKVPTSKLNLNEITQDELESVGRKNIVDPKGSEAEAFDAKMKAMMKPSKNKNQSKEASAR